MFEARLLGHVVSMCAIIVYAFIVFHMYSSYCLSDDAWTSSTSYLLLGASLASTPAQSGQRLLPKSRTGDLIAPSLANLPNALSAEYWLRKIQLQEQLGDYDVSLTPLTALNRICCCHYQQVACIYCIYLNAVPHCNALLS